MPFEINPIGVIHTPFDRLDNMPIQPSGARDVNGTIVIDEKYVQGLADLNGFSHIILLYQFHKSKGYDLMVKPFLDKTERGLFSTRAPRRPNPIGLSIVRLLQVEKNTIKIQGADVVDGTPLVDIKPYVPKFDIKGQNGPIRSGWLEKTQDHAEGMKSDQRFITQK